jgi:hypothetical protein
MVTLIELLKEYGKNKIPYQRLLETKEWDLKRSEIINRDKEECRLCNNKTTEYLLGKHVFFLEYKITEMVPNDNFWKQWEYFEKLLGEKFYGMSSSKEDLEANEKEYFIAVTLDKPYFLQVHHKYYLENKYPWEYSNEALITLCNWCHFELHQKETILVFYEKGGKLLERKLVPCLRCNGTGFLPQFIQVDNGICYRCNGERFEK